MNPLHSAPVAVLWLQTISAHCCEIHTSVRNLWRAGRDSNPRPSGSKYHGRVRSDAGLRVQPCTGLHRAAQDCTGDGPTALYGPRSNG